jgi:hypothetical protein
MTPSPPPPYHRIHQIQTPIRIAEFFREELHRVIDIPADDVLGREQADHHHAAFGMPLAQPRNVRLAKLDAPMTPLSGDNFFCIDVSIRDTVTTTPTASRDRR